ncbi:MAG: hypothetical protein LQ340_005290 [Diploschistes diacapsis]|nr:MAG: hypothetical protein LQ340_005290 [Diploschistes diacapsis]
MEPKDDVTKTTAEAKQEEEGGILGCDKNSSKDRIQQPDSERAFDNHGCHQHLEIVSDRTEVERQESALDQEGEIGERIEPSTGLLTSHASREHHKRRQRYPNPISGSQRRHERPHNDKQMHYGREREGPQGLGTHLKNLAGKAMTLAKSLMAFDGKQTSSHGRHDLRDSSQRRRPMTPADERGHAREEIDRAHSRPSGRHASTTRRPQEWIESNTRGTYSKHEKHKRSGHSRRSVVDGKYDTEGNGDGRRRTSKLRDILDSGVSCSQQGLGSTVAEQVVKATAKKSSQSQGAEDPKVASPPSKVAEEPQRLAPAEAFIKRELFDAKSAVNPSNGEIRNPPDDTAVAEDDHQSRLSQRRLKNSNKPDSARVTNQKPDGAQPRAQHKHRERKQIGS